MDDDELLPFRGEPRTPDKEGVRIIGAEEAEKAIEREDVAHRLPTDAPRFGDRPVSPRYWIERSPMDRASTSTECGTHGSRC